ncbi:serine protease [Litoricolaceae bacterium]|nr:serine protease [Litorivicinaceae bacterium]
MCWGHWAADDESNSLIAEYRTLDIRLELIAGGAMNGSGFLIDGRSVLTAAHVLDALVDQEVASLLIRTMFGSQPFLALDPSAVTYARLGDPDPDRDGRASADEIGLDLAILKSDQIRFAGSPISRYGHDATLPVTRFILEGFGISPSFEVSAGTLSENTPTLWVLDNSLTSKPGYSGSALIATSNADSHVVGITSTTSRALALGDSQWAWIDQVSQPSAPTPLRLTNAVPSDEPYPFETTIESDTLIRQSSTARYSGGPGVDRAFLDGEIDQIMMDTSSGNIQINFLSGELMELVEFEQLFTPSHRYFSTNDPIYSDLYRAITVLEGGLIARQWAGHARHWFDDDLEQVEVIDEVLSILGYLSPMQRVDEAFVSRIASTLNLSSRSPAEAEMLQTWAGDQSYRDLTLGAMSVVEEFLETEIYFGF